MDTEIDEIINENSEPTKDELDTFKNLVAEWFKYDDIIRKLVVALKERKTLQKALNSKIEDFMFKYKYNDLNTQNGRIKATMKETHKPINMKEIKDILENNKELKGEELLAKIFNGGGHKLAASGVVKMKDFSIEELFF